MRTTLVRSCSVLAAATLVLMPTAAQAAKPVAQATATALTLSIGGSPADSGTVKATTDGKSQTKTGMVAPPVDVLGNQGLLNVGALVQDAETTVKNGRGSSEACSGVAGNGGAVATVGDSNCITPGEPVGISIANLDLTGAVLIEPESALGGLAALNPVLSDLVAPITAAVSEGLEPFGNVALGGTLGAVESRCTAGPDGLTGFANIVDTTLGLDFASADIDDLVIAQLQAFPPPNTKVITELDVVINLILEAVEVQLQEGLDGLAAPLAVVVDPLQEQIIDAIIGEIAPQLAPLEENFLDITLNKQERANGAISVTAIDLKLLPAAQEFSGSPLVEAQIANVTCGPNGRVVADPDPEPNPDPDPNPNPGPGPEVPTVVDAGAFAPVDSNGSGNGLLWGLAGVALVSGVGAVAGRRLLRQ